MNILRAYIGFEKEPLLKPFGFKGNALTCLWQVAVRLKMENAEAVGLGVQSVLWSDAEVFAHWGEAEGNALMYRTTAFALAQLLNQPLRHPKTVMAELFDKAYAYAQQITGMPNLRKTFVRNALVPVDLALWQLWLQSREETSFDNIWDIPNTPQQSLANIPLITYGTGSEEILALARANTPLLKIKIGSDPKGNGCVSDMLQWDCDRLLQIHQLVKDLSTTHTESGHILYYLDANGRYDSKETLIRLLDFAQKHGILERVILLEEPFSEDSQIFVGDLPVRIAADESVHGIQELIARCALGYSALALKPIAKGICASLDMARFALEHGMVCFCADLTVNPIMVTWNQCVAARLPRLPGMLTGVVESNGSQNYANWQDMQCRHPAYACPWLNPVDGIYSLNDEFHAVSGGIFHPVPYYRTLACQEVQFFEK